MRIIIRFLSVAGAMLLAAQIVEGITVDHFWPTAVVAAFILGILNITIRPVLGILTLPINILTLGIFTFVLNALMFWLLNFLDGVSVIGFVAALLGSLAVSVVKWTFDLIFS